MTTAREFLKEGDLNAALEALQDEVRANPADAKKRIFLFQLLAVLGNWDRALNQLNVVADLDASSLAMVQTYRELLRCEALREAVFEGTRSPLVFGDPEQWIALALEALKLDASGKHDRAQAMRGEAYESAEVSGGKIADDALRVGRGRRQPYRAISRSHCQRQLLLGAVFAHSQHRAGATRGSP